MKQNDVFKTSGIDKEKILSAMGDKLNDFEKAFLLQGSCPMSRMISSDRLQADPMWKLVPEGHKECLAGCEELQTCRLGSAKLSGMDLLVDDESNREDDVTEVVKDWAREEKLTFASFEEMGNFLNAKKQATELESLSLYQLTAYAESGMHIPGSLLAKKLEEAKENTKESMKFHVCGEFMKRKYPELKTNEKRCNLCKKVVALGMVMFPATGSRDNKQVLNASIMHVDPDVELAHLGYTVSNCMFVKRSAMLEEILTQFTQQFKVGKLLEDIQITIDWDLLEKRIMPLEVDINSIGAVDMSRNAAGTSEFIRFQAGILSRAMRVPSTQVLVEKCLREARLAYLNSDKLLPPKAEERIEAFIKDTVMVYLKRYNMMTNLRWRAKTGKTDPVHGFPLYHSTPVLCTRCSLQYECQGAIVAPHVISDYPLRQRA